MSPACLEDLVSESEWREPEMPTTVAVLEERVNNHIRAFKWVAGGIITVGGAWLAIISGVLFHMNGTMNRVEVAQADAPARIIAGVLKRTPHTRDEMSDALGAASTILRTSKIGKVKPSPAGLRDLSLEIQHSQEQYPDLPIVWQTTGQFINYKSAALLPAALEQTLASARGVDCGGGGRIQSYRGGVLVEKCILDLENGIGAENVVFVNCFIRFKGGPIPIKHMEFLNCIFQFEITNIPSKDATNAMIQMTTAITQDIKVALS